MDNNSIISIPDSDTSVFLNETYSPKQPSPLSSANSMPVTPKQEVSMINTTFTPEDKKESNIQNDTFSPVKQPEKEMFVVPEDPVRNPEKRTPPKVMTESAAKTLEFSSPPPNPVPEIVVVPPSTERQTLRRSSRTRTPGKVVNYAPPTTRRSARQTPLKAVAEEKAPQAVPEDVKEPEVVAPPTTITTTDEVPKTPTKDTELEEGKDKSPVAANPFRSPLLLLKSIRKRSLSVTDVDPPMPKRNFRVQFHSPGNMEKTITEIDESLYMNFSKTLASSSSFSVNQSFNGDKRQPAPRRKRSLSNAETTLDKLATMQFLQAKQTTTTTNTTATTTPGESAKKKVPTPSPRKKMPNFAAIHSMIFSQMENVVDFSERKKERAQFLLNTTPAKPAAGPTFAKPVNRGAVGKVTVPKKQSNLMKPKNMRTIGKRTTSAKPILSERKMEAILQSTDIFPSLMLENSSTATAQTEAEKDIPVAEKPAVVPETKNTDDIKENVSRIKKPRVYTLPTAKPAKPMTNIDSSTLVKNVAAPPLKKKVTEEPRKAANGRPPQPPVVKGVRVNRRFELMMKYRQTKKP